jgi:hypothetical protein
MKDFIGRERGAHHWLGKMNATSSHAAAAGTEVAGLEGIENYFLKSNFFRTIQISFDQSLPDGLSDSSLVVMTPLICGIDYQKPG